MVDHKLNTGFGAISHKVQIEIAHVNMSPYCFCLSSDGGHGIADSEFDTVIELVLNEIESVSLDHLTYTEFEHMMATAPDFTRLFAICLL